MMLGGLSPSARFTVGDLRGYDCCCLPRPPEWDFAMNISFDLPQDIEQRLGCLRGART